MAFSDEIRRFGITLPVWRVLAQLWHDEFQRQNDISERTAIEPATLSRLLKSIEAKGLIVRTRSSTNAREVGVALTRKGRALAQRIIPLAMRYEALAIGSMPPEKADLVKDALIEIYQNIASYHDVLKGKVPGPPKAAAARRAAAPVRKPRR